MKKKTVAVEGTNDSSIVSKCSMVNVGYFKDDAIHFFVGKQGRRSPLINRGYYARAMAIDTAIDTFLNLHRCKCQILSLGAGFDSTYFRLHSEEKLTPDVVYYEVDFPDVAVRKSKLILNESWLKNRLTSFKIGKEIVLNSKQYKLVGANLEELPRLNALLDECGIDENLPTLIMSECVLSYLPARSGSQVARWSAEKFRNAVFVTYEQIFPHDGFGRIMMNHFNSIGAPLKSVHDFPSVECQIQRYLNNGWDDCRAVTLNEFLERRMTKDELTRINDLQPFDEFEEWHAKCNHYLILWATVGEMCRFLNAVSPHSCIVKEKQLTYRKVTCEYRANIDATNRYGHCSILFGSYVFTFGGFGSTKTGHRRLNHLERYDLRSGTCIRISLNALDLDKGGRMHHTGTLLTLQEDALFVFGGRTSPDASRLDALYIPLKRLAVNESLSEIESFDCQIKCWDDAAPESRWRHSASCVHLSHRELVVIFGGRSISSDRLDDCHVLDVSTWKWKKVPKQMDGPSARHSHASATWRHNVIVSCGLGDMDVPLSSIHSFDCDTETWQQLPFKGIAARYSHTSHVFEDKLYLVGGVGRQRSELPDVTVLNLLLYESYDVMFQSLTPNISILLHNHASVMDENTGEMYVVGGGGNCFSFGTHFNDSILRLKLESEDQLYGEPNATVCTE